MFCEKIANVNDEGKEKAFEVFRVQRRGEGESVIQLEHERVFSAEALYRELLKANVDMPLDRAAAIYQLEQVVSCDPPAQWVYASAGGWRGDAAAFLLGDRLIGDTGGPSVLPPGGPAASTRINFLRRGRLAQWQQDVAAPSLLYPPWVAAISAAFVAPLLGPCGWSPFRLHLFGSSLRRRSTAVVLVGSVVGFGARHIQELTATSAAMVPEAATLLNDLPIPFEPDEGEWAPLRSSKFVPVALGLLGSASGGGGAIFQRRVEGWRGVIVSGGRADTGPQITVDARGRACNSWKTINLPMLSAQWRETPSQIELKATGGRIRRSSERQLGTAFPRYLKHLVAQHDHLPDLAKAFVATFRRATARSDGRRYDPPLLTCFGRLYAGGAMAIAAGVLPGTEADLCEALKACLEAADRHMRRGAVTLAALRKRLQEQLQDIEAVDATGSALLGPDARAGFWTLRCDERVYTIHGKSFRDWFANRAEQLAVLGWLHQAGHLRLGDRQTKPSRSSTEWAERTIRWSDRRVHRSYVFHDPFGQAAQES